MTTYRDLTPVELKYADRDILAGRLAAIQQERAELLAQVTAAKGAESVIELATAYYWATGTPDEADAHNDLIDAVAALVKDGAQ